MWRSGKPPHHRPDRRRTRQLPHRIHPPPDGHLVAEETDHGTSYYLTDNLGSIVGLVTNTGTALAQYAYDPAGNTRDITGNPAEQALNPWGYAGGYTETTGYTTGLTKYGARYYDPDTSRFTQQEPTGQESNPYAYTADNPVNNVDPTGFSFLNISVSVCLGSCVSAGVDVSSDSLTPTGGVGVGPDAGVDASGTDDGVTTATDAGCEADATFTG